MRKIEKWMVRTILDHETGRKSNTEVISEFGADGMISEVLLHGNLIARVLWDSYRLVLTDAGWQTTTTKSRLNSILKGFDAPFHIFQEDFSWFIGDSNWEVRGEWKDRAVFLIGEDGRVVEYLEG